MPDTGNLHTFVDLIECPDTSALEYNVPLWSEKHWGMIAEVFKVIRQTGSRTVYIPLIAHTNLGNEESMVRWVKKGRTSTITTSASWTGIWTWRRRTWGSRSR